MSWIPTAAQPSADEHRWALFDAETIRTTHLKPLIQTLEADFEVEPYGYAQLKTIADNYERAVVSDLIARSSTGVADSLLEARIAQHAFVELIPADGFRIPTADTIGQNIRDSTLQDIYLGAFVKSLESAFDCLAAIAIGVLRVPWPINKAQLSQFNSSAGLNPQTQEQARSWNQWQSLIDNNAAAHPVGWRRWLNQMRHLYVHRAHQSKVLLQRTVLPQDPKVLFVSETPERDMMGVARFDIHLRSQPALADMEDYVLSVEPSDLWLDETAQVTLPGVFDAANEFVEEAAQFLLSWWRYAEKWSSSAFPPPAKAWKPATSPGDRFAGVAPQGNPMQPASGAADPNLGNHLAVAQRLRTGT